jgi:2'-5' RNA ligase
MRFSIVSYLDPKSTAIVRAVQQELADLTGAKASLELWKPHITVGDGIEIEGQELASLKEKFEVFSLKEKPFEVDLRDIIKMDTRKGGEGEITTPYGLYVEVQPNEFLMRLVSNVSLASKGLKKWYSMPRPYHPHCALVFKDLNEDGFRKGIDYLKGKDLKLTVILDHVSLVEMSPKATREFARFNFAE